MRSIFLVAVMSAAPFDGPDPTKLCGDWGSASWVIPVRARGWSPMDPLVRTEPANGISFLADGGLAWGDEMAGVACPMGPAKRLGRGTYEFALCDELPPGRWTWLAGDRATVELPQWPREVVRLRGGESLQSYKTEYYWQLRAKVWPRLVGHYHRDGGDLVVKLDGGVDFNGESRAGWVTECLRECWPDAGAALCIETERDTDDPMYRDHVLWAFTNSRDGGVTAWATSNEHVGHCAVAPAAQKAEPVPLLRVP